MLNPAPLMAGVLETIGMGAAPVFSARTMKSSGLQPEGDRVAQRKRRSRGKRGLLRAVHQQQLKLSLHCHRREQKQDGGSRHLRRSAAGCGS